MRSDRSTPAWQPLIDELVARSWQRLIVIGAPDRGKSSFCDALLCALQSQGMKASLLDTALGDKIIGPPACLTLGQRTADGYNLKDLYFVGGLDSTRRMPAMISGAARLAAVTGGTVNAPGRLLKGLKIDALRPDHIVAIGNDEELDPFLALKPQSLIHQLPPGDGVQPRNAMARALNRLRAFQTILAHARMRELRNLVVEPWHEDAFDWTQGEYICGLADADGKEHGIGILHQADAVNGLFQITTTVEADLIHRVRIGMLLPDELRE